MPKWVNEPPRKRYPKEVRQRALELYVEKGPVKAGEELGIKGDTVSQWASRAGMTTDRREYLEASITMRQLTAHERRARLCELLEVVAAEGLEATLRRLHSEPDLHPLVGAWTRAIHDLALLSGEATSRTETVDRDERLERLAELQETLAKLAAGQ